MAENLPVYGRNKMARRREALAMLGTLSGDPVLMEAGKQMTRNAAHPQPIMNLGRGVMYDPNSGSSQIAPEYQAQVEAAREHDRDLLGTRLSARKATGGKGGKGSADGNASDSDGPSAGTASERKQIAQYERELTIGNAILEAMKGSPSAIHPGVDIASDLVGKLYGPVRNLTERAFYDDDEQKVRNQIRRFIAGIRKTELGSAVTGYELEKEQEWSPIATGITQDEAVRRMETFLRDHGVALEALRNQLGGRATNPFGKGKELPLQVGHMQGGYRYIGGDPASEDSWEAMR